MGGASSKLTLVFGMLANSAALGSDPRPHQQQLAVTGDRDRLVPPLRQRLAFGMLAHHSAVLGEQMARVHGQVGGAQFAERSQHLQVGAQLSAPRWSVIDAGAGSPRQVWSMARRVIVRASDFAPSAAGGASRSSTSEQAFRHVARALLGFVLRRRIGFAFYDVPRCGIRISQPDLLVPIHPCGRLRLSGSPPAQAVRRGPRPPARWEWSAPGSLRPEWARVLPCSSITVPSSCAQ